MSRPKKKSDQRKSDLIRIRVTEEQKQLLEAAADRAGLDVSSWLRSLGIQAAKKG